MAKLTKHAEVLTQLHTMVKKQAEEAQKNISGAPGKDVKAVSVGDEHENYNKNSVGPENVPQSYSQKPSDDPAEPLAGSKTAEDIGAEILDIIRKQAAAEAQSSVSGKPGDVKSESTDDKPIDKNSVKPEKNTPQKHEQKASTDESKPLANAKKAEVEDLAVKVASYELGRQFCAALLKTAGDYSAQDDAEMMKEAGRRDFDLWINEAAEKLGEAENAQDVEKQAEEAGAAYFEETLKEAALREAIAENEKMAAKLAAYENYYTQEQHKIAAYQQAQSIQEQQTKWAESVADLVLDRLKSDIVPVQAS